MFPAIGSFSHRDVGANSRDVHDRENFRRDSDHEQDSRYWKRYVNVRMVGGLVQPVLNHVARIALTVGIARGISGTMQESESGKFLQLAMLSRWQPDCEA
jgi:hypothetical protein